MYDFTFKGINSRDLGITVNRRPPRESANTRSTITEIDGVDGGYIEKVGLNTYVMEFDMTVEGLHNVEKITGWLQGQGEFRRSDVPKRALWVEHQAPLEFQYLTDDLYTCTTTFFVTDPTWYLVEDDWKEPWGKNLIPDGWDSFEPYGSGKNYVENWDFSSDDLSSWRGYRFDNKIQDGRLIGTCLQGISPKTIEYINDDIPVGNYIFRIKGNFGKGVTFQTWTGANIVPKKIDGIGVIEIPFTKLEGRLQVRIYSNDFDIGDTIEIDWIQITPVDNQHLVVEKTPLENGLTRIQTWGGSSLTKLIYRHRVSNPDYSEMIMSLYVENLDISPLKVDNIGNGVTLSENDSKFISFNSPRTNDERFRIKKGNDDLDNLDFIASDPQIVEGDKPTTWEADDSPRIINEGNYKSKPIIKIEKGTSEAVDVLINKTRFVYIFKENDKQVIIDCEEQTAVDEQGRNRIRNLKIGYEFPTLRPGPNTVKILDGDGKISFRRTDRWR